MLRKGPQFGTCFIAIAFVALLFVPWGSWTVLGWYLWKVIEVSCRNKLLTTGPDLPVNPIGPGGPLIASCKINTKLIILKIIHMLYLSRSFEHKFLSSYQILPHLYWYSCIHNFIIIIFHYNLIIKPFAKIRMFYGYFAIFTQCKVKAIIPS